MNFLANPIVHSIGLAPCGPGCEFQTFTYFVIDPCQVPILTDLDFANVKRRGKFLPREFVQSSVGNHSMGCLALTNHPGIYYGVAQSRTRLNRLSSSSSSMLHWKELHHFPISKLKTKFIVFSKACPLMGIEKPSSLQQAEGWVGHFYASCAATDPRSTGGGGGLHLPQLQHPACTGLAFRPSQELIGYRELQRGLATVRRIWKDEILKETG